MLSNSAYNNLSASLSSGCGVFYDPTYLNSLFRNSHSYLNALSNTLSAYPTSGTVTVSGKTITLTGTLFWRETFFIHGSDLANANTIEMKNIAEFITFILINVDGVTCQMKNLQMPYGAGTKVLFNFYQATSLTLSSIDIEGSILAINADTTANSGQLNGQFFGNSWNGNFGIHYYLFDGCIPQ